MKPIIPAFAFLIAVVFLSSCTQSYTCGRQCFIFNNGAIKICQTTAAESAQFYKSTDSLSHLYGSYISVFEDSVSVGGTSQNAINTITNQLAQQGYTCHSNNP